MLDMPTVTSDAEAELALNELDETLAGLEDEMLMGDFESPDGEKISPESLQQSDASALLDQLGMDDISFAEELPSGDTDEADAPIDESQSTPTETVDAKVAAQARAKANAQPTPRSQSLGPEPIANEPEEEVLSVWAHAQRFIVTHATHAWSLFKTHGGPYAARAVLLVNKPIKDRPAQLRDSIGYLALWTVLLAAVLWVYIAFIRETPTPSPSQAPTRVLEPGEVIDPLHNNDARP